MSVKAPWVRNSITSKRRDTAFFKHDFGSKLARIYTPFQQTRLSSFHMLRNAGGMQGSFRLRARQALTGIISLRVKNAFTVKGLAHGG